MHSLWSIPRWGSVHGLLLFRDMWLTASQPSYTQDMGSHHIEQGLYGSMIHSIGTCVRCIAIIPCCLFSNLFCNVQQGNSQYNGILLSSWLWHCLPTGSVGLVSHFGYFKKAIDPGLVKVNVHGISRNCVCKDPDQRHWMSYLLIDVKLIYLQHNKLL